MVSGAIVWVTGATGRLGCEITGRLEELGATPVPLVLEGYPMAPRRRPWNADTAPRSASSGADLDALPPPDHVLNAHWSVDRELAEVNELVHAVDHNIGRPAFLWDWLAANFCGRFVNVSSTKVYGRANDSPVGTETEPRPDTGYGVAKVTAERWFDARFGDTSVVPVHVRLCSIAAAGGHPSQLLPRLCDSAFSGRPMTINRRHSVQIVHIAEATDLLIAAVFSSEPGPFVVAPHAVSVERIARLFEAQAGSPLEATYVDGEPEATEPVVRPNTASLSADWVRHHCLEDLVASIAHDHRARMDPTPAS